MAARTYAGRCRSCETMLGVADPGTLGEPHGDERVAEAENWIKRAVVFSSLWLILRSCAFDAFSLAVRRRSSCSACAFGDIPEIAPDVIDPAIRLVPRFQAEIPHVALLPSTTRES